MFLQFALVDGLEVAWQALRHHWVRLWCHLHDLLLRMAVDEAEVLLELVIGGLEFKVGWDVPAQPIFCKESHRLRLEGDYNLM